MSEPLASLQPTTGATTPLETRLCALERNKTALEMQNRDLQQLRDELLQSQARLANLYHFSPVGSVTFDQHGFIHDSNRVAANLLGAEPERLFNSSFNTLTVKEDLELFLEHLHRCQEHTGKLVISELRLARPQAAPVWVQLVSTGQYDPELLEVLYRTAIIDISERKRVEEKLRQNQQNYGLLVNSVTGILWEATTDPLRFTFVSRQTAALLGYPPDDWLFEPDFFEKHLHPDDRAGVLDSLKRLDKEATRVIEFRMRTAHGESLWLRNLITMVQLPEHSLKLRGVMVDVTEHKRLESVLAESEAQYRLLFEKNTQPMFIYDQATLQFLTVNRAAAACYGYSPAEFLKMNLRDLHSPQYLPLLKKVMESPDLSKAPAVWEHRSRAGVSLQMEVAFSPLTFQGHAAVLCMARDVTGRLHQEQRLAVQHATTRALAQAQNVLDIVGGITSHLRGEQSLAVQHATARILSEAETLAEAGPRLLEVVCEHLGWMLGEIWQVDPAANVLRFVDAWHKPAATLQTFVEHSRPLTFTPGQGLPGTIWVRGEALGFHKLPSHRQNLRVKQMAQAGMQTALGFPICMEHRVLGVVIFFAAEERTLDAEMRDLFAVIGGQIGQFIERRKSAEELRRKEELFRSLIENSSETIAILDATGNILYKSPSCERVLGYTPEEMLGENVFALVHPEDRPGLLKIFTELVSHKEQLSHTHSYRFRHRDGRWLILESTGANLLDHPAVGGIVVNSRDVTERAQAEERIRQFNNTLEERVTRRTNLLRQANEVLKDEIAQRKRLEQEILEISEREQHRIGQDLHDGIQQYLAGISYLAHILEKNLRADSQKTHAKDAHRIVDLLGKATEQIRQLARGLHPVRLDETDGLPAAFRDLAANTKDLFKVECTFRCEASLKLPDRLAATHLYRIAQEAVHNALKHGKAKTITIHLSGTATGLRLSVMNDGRRFEKKPTTRKGMGLDTMAYRAHVIGATLNIRPIPAPRQGTIVTCKLPLKKTRKK